jgi:hypothetical protein
VGRIVSSSVVSSAVSSVSSSVSSSAVSSVGKAKRRHARDVGHRRTARLGQTGGRTMNNSPSQARLAAFENEILTKYKTGTPISQLARDYKVETKTIRKFLTNRKLYPSKQINPGSC